MNNTRKIGKMLLISTLTSTPDLMDNITAGLDREDDSLSTVFAGLTDAQLYARLLTDIDFSKLSSEEQNKFLLLKPEYAEEVDKQNLYANEMREFVQEAHNRTCKALGVKPTRVIVCNFGENYLLDPWEFTAYDIANGNIYVNSEADFSVRPTFLLESINARTFQHATYESIATAVTKPNLLDDKSYYLALTSAIKEYVYQENREVNADGHFLIDDDGYTPSSLSAQIYAFEKTRADLQSAGLYGLHVRETIREAEEDFHADLQEHIGNDSLLNSEDMFAFFKGSSLNAGSNGLLGKMLDILDSEYSQTFYNSIGADMPQNCSVRQYLDSLENNMFEVSGLTPPTPEDLEYLEELEQAEREYLQELEELGLLPDDEEQPEGQLLFSNVSTFFRRDDEDKADDEYVDYEPFDSVLPSEGMINIIKTLPFHNNSEQQDLDIAK